MDLSNVIIDKVLVANEQVFGYVSQYDEEEEDYYVEVYLLDEDENVVEFLGEIAGSLEDDWSYDEEHLIEATLMLL